MPLKMAVTVSLPPLPGYRAEAAACGAGGMVTAVCAAGFAGAGQPYVVVGGGATS